MKPTIQQMEITMSTTNSARRVDELTNSELDKIIRDLVSFYNFTFFGERGVTQNQGLVFSLEQLAVSYGLVGNLTKNDESPVMMREFVGAIDKRATVINAKDWPIVREFLPFLAPFQGRPLRSLVLEN
tara:strand:+ start:2749 stop:3132 length:384 start_codon:yes stop_codon:yes gene_type:complete